MAIQLEIGEIVSAPPSGKQLLKLDSDGAPVLVDSNGAESAMTVGAASATENGTMSSEDFVKVGNLDFDDWFTDVCDIIHAACPAITNIREIKIGDGAGIADGEGPLATQQAAIDGAVDGGAIANDTAKGAAFSTASIVNGPKTVSWAVAMRSRVLATSGVSFNLVGLFNAGGTHSIGVAAYHVTDPTDKYLLYSYDGQEVAVVTAVSCDTAWHTFVVSFDGTTLKLFIDGVLRASTTDLGGITTQPMFAAQSSSIASAVKTARYAYGYVAP